MLLLVSSVPKEEKPSTSSSKKESVSIEREESIKDFTKKESQISNCVPSQSDLTNDTTKSMESHITKEAEIENQIVSTENSSRSIDSTLILDGSAKSVNSDSQSNIVEQQKDNNDTIIKKQELVKDDQETLNLSIDDTIKLSTLPETVIDEDYSNKLKVFNNYRTFGAMYFAKNNFKKAEWAFKNGIKQALSSSPKSKEQLRSSLMAEVEFRLLRARCLKSLGDSKEAVEECKNVLKIETNCEAKNLLQSLS